MFRDSADRWHAEYQCLLGEKYIVEAEEAEARQKLEALVTESARVLTITIPGRSIVTTALTVWLHQF